MKVYTMDNNVKQKLLDNLQVLITEREVDGNLVSIFYIKDLSVFNHFSNKERKEIFTINNSIHF